MAATCYTDEELDRDALSVIVMDDGEKIRVLPNDHPYILARYVRYNAEAQARRDAMRIDANHHIAGDEGDEGLIPYLDGKPVPDAVECYIGAGWVKRLVRVDGDDALHETTSGYVELRPKT
jgi:hypothetical protein